MDERRVEDAEAALAGGQLMMARALAMEGLVDDPDNPRLLRVAGMAGLELDLDDAVRHLRALVRVTPDDAEAWRDLGFAEVSEGEVDRAASAFERVLDLVPGDASATTHLAHTRHAQGRHDEAISLLLAAAEAGTASASMLRSLLGMARDAQQWQTALDTARRLAAQDPKDPVAAMEIADLLLTTGAVAEAARAFHRLRSIDSDDGHETYACHGEAEAFLRAGRWREALDVSIHATRLDRHQLTTDVLAYAASKLFGEGERPAPPWPELEEALVADRAEHRRLHMESEVL